MAGVAATGARHAQADQGKDASQAIRMQDDAAGSRDAAGGVRAVADGLRDDAHTAEDIANRMGRAGAVGASNPEAAAKAGERRRIQGQVGEIDESAQREQSRQRFDQL